MKTGFLLILLLSLQFSHAQQTPAPKPKYVTIINDEIVSQEKVQELVKQGAVKNMRKGVSEEERARLVARLGEQVGEKEFIIVITEEDKAAKSTPAAPVKTESKKSSGVIVTPGEVAKDFTVTLLNGTQVKLSDLKGKVVLLNFWATWCAPCLLAFYDIPSKILEPYKNDAFVFLPISKGEAKEKVAEKMAHLKTKGIDFPVAIDPTELIATLYGADTLPKNILIDKNGVVRFVMTGNAEGNIEKLAEEIKRLVQQ